FAKATRLIRAMLMAGGETTRDLDPDDLVAYCESIAAASGGIFGIGAVSSGERQVIEGLQQALRNRN
ncbi:MAG: hypothetical protein H0X67_19440, partial [Acidobacteria bacterium]|nr:hypothetical protein [Acidobacteriota bacterium]